MAAMDIFRTVRFCVPVAAVALAFTSCFTGIENTGKISEKDVAKVKANRRAAEEAYFDTVAPAPYAEWHAGKRFYVSDNNIRLILNPSADSLRGRTLEYRGVETLRQIDNSEDVLLVFSDGGKEYRYNTGKTMPEVAGTQPEYLVPFMIDSDFVERVDKMLRGKTFFIKTSDWKRRDGTPEKGVRYVPAEIESVSPGDAVYPFYVAFTCNGGLSGIFMSSQTSPVKNMTFDKLFSFDDIRKDYKTVSDENWDLITKGRVAQGMTKEECALSLGAPRSIVRTPTHGGLYERWVYANGVYLIFESGLLTDYRQ